ncbi:MAG TPA: hypothetical protein VM369_09230 [Candidatus Binatia bacterium]|nr:hypothetical protein [Candidatus Binatia bacterium]
MKRGVVLLAGFMSAAAAVPAMAVDVTDAASQSSVYLRMNFGGASQQVHALHYGFQMDRVHRETGDLRPATLTMDFTRQGFREAYLAGMPVGHRLKALAQNDTGGQPTDTGAQPTDTGVQTTPTEQTAPADGGTGEAVATESTGEVPAEEHSWYDPRGWGWMGWTAAAVVVGGVAYVALDSGDSSSSGSGGGGGDGGGGGGTGEDLCAPDQVPGVGGECVPAGLPMIGTAQRDWLSVEQVDTDRMLQSGSGQMGDLVAR